VVKHATPGESSWEPNRPVSTWAKVAAVIILLLTAYMTYQEVSIAFAQADNRLVHQYASVEEVSETLSSSQDAERVSIGPDRITLEVNGTRTVIDATRPYISQGDSIEVDTWNDKVIRAEGGYVHEGWTSYYGIFLSIATIVPLWVFLRFIAESRPFGWWRRNGKSITWGAAVGMLLTATMLVLMQSTGTLFWWPVVSFLGSVIALIVAARRKAPPHEMEHVVPLNAPPLLEPSDMTAALIDLAESNGAVKVTVTEHDGSQTVTLHNTMLSPTATPLQRLLLQKLFGLEFQEPTCTLKRYAFGPWLEQLNLAHATRPTVQEFPAGSLAQAVASQEIGAVGQWANAQSAQPAWLDGIVWQGGSTPRSVMLSAATSTIMHAFSPWQLDDNSDRMTE
jgi:hypothetical protein